MSKPGKVLKALCKKLGIRLTVKRGQKRVYKSIAVLKRQCAKKKKVKRRRRFGMKALMEKYNVPKLPEINIQEFAAEKINHNILRQNLLQQALKKEYTKHVIYMLKMNANVQWIETVIESAFKADFMKKYNLTGDEYDKLVKTQNINVQQIKDRLERERDYLRWYQNHQKEHIEKMEALKKKERERQESFRKEIEEIEEKDEEYKKAAYKKREKIQEERERKAAGRIINNNNNNENKSSGSSNSKSGFYRNVYSPRIGLRLLIVVVILGLGGTGTFFLVKALGKEEDKKVKRKRRK